MAKEIKIPTRYIYTDPGYKTKYLQHVRSGAMQGRQGREKTKLPSGVVARTDTSQAAENVRRVKANKSSSYEDYAGEIFGRRGGRVKVKGSARSRGYSRSTL
jgi:hypothetical protein